MPRRCCRHLSLLLVPQVAIAAALAAVEEMAEVVMRSRGAMALVESGLGQKEEENEEEEEEDEEDEGGAEEAREEKENRKVSQSPSPRRL